MTTATPQDLPITAGAETNSTPDAQIIDAVQRGQLQTYGLLVDRYELAVFATALAILRDRHLAEDVAQEVFVQGYAKLRTLRQPEQFSHWLLKMTRRQAYRASRRRRRLQPLSLEAAPSNELIAASPPLNEESEHLLQQVHKLPVHERITLCLRYFDGHSTQTIARMTGRPIGTVTKRLSRALERLRELFRSEN